MIRNVDYHAVAINKQTQNKFRPVAYSRAYNVGSTSSYKEKNMFYLLTMGARGSC